jgi:RNA polymerase sigma-70 factor (ECF subfamily)
VPTSNSDSLALYLARLRSGDAAAANEMLPCVYDELRSVAAALLRDQRPGHTLQATALVHEAWLKIARASGDEQHFEGRAHFLAVAATAMRQILVNHARDRRRQKRGGAAQKLPLDAVIDRIEVQAGDLVALDDALATLAAQNRRHAQIVELRVFGGLTIQEVAEALGVGVTTVKTDWRFACAYLQKLLPRAS